MANEPVQVVTNPERLRGPREKTPPNSAGKDFFAGNDDGFRAHRNKLARQLRGILSTIDSVEWVRDFGGLAHVQVSMRRDAIAKSYRPQTALFRESLAPHIATARIAEPLFAVTGDSLRKVLQKIESVPDGVRFVPNTRTGEIEARPSRGRCEASGIAAIDLWVDADKRDFSAAEAATWLSRAGTGGNYLVTMFPMRSGNNRNLASAQQRSARTLQTMLGRLSIDARARPATGWTGGQTISMRVLETGSTPRLELGLVTTPVGANLAPTGAISADMDDHAAALDVLARNPLVRDITLPALPARIEASPTSTGQLALTPIPDRPQGPASLVGVIDGGISDVLGDWIEDRFDLLDPSARDTDHGTFISGLLVAANSLNADYLSNQAPGCAVIDIGVLPADPGGTGIPFQKYYPNGVSDFMDEVETAVQEYRQRLGVRVFNFSLNFVAPGNPARYGYAAQRLDEIARANDVIFVISAGNLEVAEQRAEWHQDPQRAIAALVSEAGTTITEPAESLFNISVSALNPPNLPNQVPYALTTYSRRGPGLRGAIKPDFAHIGGSGTSDPHLGTGLASINSDGTLTNGAGTSYAAPLVAKQLADLDSLIEGDVTRETLIALMVHHAAMPAVMKHPAVLPAARDLAGFGMPSTAEDMLQGPDSEITLVFNGTILPKEQHTLVFGWPEALVENGKCRGYARLTLVARPVLAYEHGDERVRVNIEAKLMQENGKGGFSSALSPVNRPSGSRVPRSEPELLEAQKWQVVKCFETAKMRGKGESSTWKFLVEYLTRAEEQLPMAGVEFAAILTISDLDGEAPVFQQMRQQLGALNIQTSAIRTSVRTRLATTSTA